jgi:coenzyme F420-reducing hydrogenase alpha subunit
MTTEGLEGQIRITLGRTPGSVLGVIIANSRPLGLAERLSGLEPEAALRRVGLLFSACRIAQGIAGCQAVESAWGVELAPAHAHARDLLLAGETVLEHAMSIFLRWPSLLGKPAIYLPVVRQLRSSLGDLWRAVYPEGDWMRPGGGTLRPDHAALAARLEAAREALESADLAALVAADELEAWLATGHGPANDLLCVIEKEEWMDYGASKVAFLDAVDPGTLAALLADDQQRCFVAQPHWQGTTRLTGPLVRQKEETLVRAAIERYGCGLAAHFLAQCVETQRSLESMNALCQLRECDAAAVKQRDGHGLGLVQAARGLLAHRVEIEEGRVQRYQILAPTEWNFQSGGAVAGGLRNAAAAGSVPANLLVAALNPCVPWLIEWRPFFSIDARIN